ncbi:helix-turn-helix transcriptional regulator [Streptomyces koyangensis]|uniref:helix-turn-helix transcriptional regulator n=1 Tax=Streptomyces koyangensis TaxID=188770 RepID=UPI0034550887
MDDHDLIRHPLAYARIQAGWTQPGLADRVRRAAERRGLHSGTRKQRIWAWETGRARPDADSQSYLAEIFGVDPAVAAATPWPDWLPGREQPHPFTRHSTAPALREALRTSMDRRTFLAYSTAALTGLTHQWATTEPAALTRSLDGDRLDPDLLDVLEESGLRLAGMITHQRQHTLAALDGHLATVTDLIADATYTADQAARLHTLGARLAQTVGWTRFDAGQHAAAARLWHGALHSAHAARDRDLGAGIISDLAYQATWRRDPATAAAILQHAVARTEHPTARALLHLRLARAQAALGDAGDCRASLRAAEHNLDRTTPDPAPAWCAWFGPEDLQVDTGQALVDLGDTGEGDRLIDRGIGHLAPARAKTRAVFLSYRASSLLAQGHADEASVAATDSLTLAQTIGAPRCVTLIQRLRPRFEEHSQAPGVAEFLHASQVAGA